MLEINNTDLDMRSVFNNSTFSKSLKSLSIRNTHKKQKLTAKLVPTFDIKEIEAVGGMLQNLSHFTLAGCTVTDEMLKCLFAGFRRLKGLTLRDCHGFTNHIFLWICMLLQDLEELTIEGGPHRYLTGINYEGIQVFSEYGLKLKKISLNYCAKVGQKCIDIMASRFEYETLTRKSLVELEIIRNCFEKTCNLNAEQLSSLRRCSNLTRLTIVYSRNVTDDIIDIFRCLPNLQVLNLR